MKKRIMIIIFVMFALLSIVSFKQSYAVESKEKVISEHISATRTKADIRKKYQQTKPTYNYNTSIYQVTPSWKNPYKEGSLKTQVINDTLNTLNYNRWLIGVDEITTNTSKMARSQKGAVISKANNEISHTPSKPSDMEEAFYKEAYDGCNAKWENGDIYSGNVSYGDRKPYEAIRGFISDIYNISPGSATGHRQSMLDPKATQISFGQCEEYSTASIYFDYTKALKEKYYAFPPAGYFPNSEMKIGEYWSFYFTEKVQGTPSVIFTYNGKQYKGESLVKENGYPVISFKLPSELRKLLGNDNSNVPSGTKIQVEILGLKDEEFNNIKYKYNVTFFNINSDKPNVNYCTHIQDIGWEGKYAKNGETSGTSGKSLRLEGIKIKLNNNEEYSGEIEYQTHIQDIGWQDWKKNDAMSGTTGKSLRLEAIRIKLTGDIANSYDVYYRVHCQNFGWLDWAKNGAPAGSAGYAYRLEAIEIKLVKKGEKAPGNTTKPYIQNYVSYQTHIQDIGWQGNAKDGATSGTSGRSLRLEGIKIALENQLYEGNIEYQTHIQNLGWEKNFVKNGAMSGTTGKSLRLEAIRIRLTGTMAQKYDIYYRVHCQDFGWMGWTKNGASAGSAGYSYRLEAIQICLVEKGGKAPGSTANSFRSK